MLIVCDHREMMIITQWRGERKTTETTTAAKRESWQSEAKVFFYDVFELLTLLSSCSTVGGMGVLALE
jgi:hypothetical protein